MLLYNSQVNVRDVDDDNQWVQDQIRKGVGVGQTAQQASAQTAAAFAKHAGGGAPILSSRAAADEVSRSGQAAMQALQHTLQRMKVCTASFNGPKTLAATDSGKCIYCPTEAPKALNHDTLLVMCTVSFKHRLTHSYSNSIHCR